MRHEISNLHGIFSIRSLLTATGDWCRRNAARLWRRVSGIVWSIRSGCRSDLFEGGHINAPQPLMLDFCGKSVELKKLTSVMTVGDRIRVLCDDGFLMAEKVSQTEFRLIEAQGLSKLVH